MKLRLRSIQSKETFKIDLPTSSTLPQLKQILSQLLPDSPHPASIRLSLNRKDALQSDGEEFLGSLGIATGDLIFFSFEQQPGMMIGTSSNPQNTTDCPPKPETQNSANTGRNLDLVVLDSQLGKTNTLGNDTQIEEEMKDYMEVEKTEGNGINPNSDPISSESVGNPHPVPVFLRKIFNSEMDSDRNLIVTAIHAVMLDSGFIPFDDRNSNKPFGTSLQYTLPELLNDIKFSAVLKFQNLQKFITVYGTTSSGSGSSTYRVHFNEDQLAPFLNAVLANCGETGVINKVLEFWRSAKDNLALPLLIDLHEEAGLQLPPCFMRLGMDLKSKILEYLPGVDIARVCCVCTELQHLGSNDDLWRLKFNEEYGTGTFESNPNGSWKKAFIVATESRSNSRHVVQRSVPFFGHARRRYPHPNPFMVPRVPRIIGGDYDIYGEDVDRGWRIDGGMGNHRRRMGMNISPGCNLGIRFV